MVLAMLIPLLTTSATVGAEPKALLVAPEGNYVARALEALATPHDRRCLRPGSPYSLVRSTTAGTP